VPCPPPTRARLAPRKKFWVAVQEKSLNELIVCRRHEHVSAEKKRKTIELVRRSPQPMRAPIAAASTV
jgi:hypothetical protein